MHAGGVAESSGPWNDDKDPFEVEIFMTIMMIRVLCTFHLPVKAS